MTTNLFADIPQAITEELFTTLFKKEGLHIERIVSEGQITPLNQWYNQDWDEWVIVLQGRALLRYELDNQCLELKVGDYVLITANTRHRVEWTQPDSQTIWLAIHYKT
jgi:cupin 2 domain-containing protein